MFQKGNNSKDQSRADSGLKIITKQGLRFVEIHTDQIRFDGLRVCGLKTAKKGLVDELLTGAVGLGFKDTFKKVL